MKITTLAKPDGITTTIDFEGQTARRCGACSLCCKLLPNAELHKPAGKPCHYQRLAKGCTIYARRPFECESWACRWLAAPEETAGLRRPDRAHYVIDAMVDEIRIVPKGDGEPQIIPALQVWADPAFPKIHHAPDLRAYLLKMATAYGLAAIVRWDNKRGLALFPPPFNDDGEWHEIELTLNTKFGNYSRLPADIRKRLDPL